MLGADFEIINVQKSTLKIFTMSGVTRIIKIKEKSEEIQDKINEEITNKLKKEEKNEGII